MKYIKKFEELSPATYANAAIALSKLGHHQRSKKLDDWRIDQVMKKYKDEWKNLISTYSKYGKAKVKITKHESTNVYQGYQGYSSPVVRTDTHSLLHEREGLDYYLAINVDSELTEKLNKSLSISKDNIDIKIPLNISLIPIDESNYGNFLNYYGLSLQIMKAGVYYTVDEGVLQFEGVSIDTSKVYKGQSNNGVDIDILDRKSAITIKNSILACFDESQDYIGIYQEDRMYDFINKNIISKNELDIDLNLTMDRIHQDIKSYSLNKLYKDSNN